MEYLTEPHRQPPGSGREFGGREEGLIAGTLDDKSLFKPVISLFCEQAASWVEMPKETQNLPRYYT